MRTLALLALLATAACAPTQQPITAQAPACELTIAEVKARLPALAELTGASLGILARLGVQVPPYVATRFYVAAGPEKVLILAADGQGCVRATAAGARDAWDAAVKAEMGTPA